MREADRRILAALQHAGGSMTAVDLGLCTGYTSTYVKFRARKLPSCRVHVERIRGIQDVGVMRRHYAVVSLIDET